MKEETVVTDGETVIVMPKNVEKEFRHSVSELSKNKSIIRAVYHAYDEWVDRESLEIACRKGCSKCCHQVITCTRPEIDEIFKYIENLPKSRRRELIVRLKKTARKYLKWYQKNKELMEGDSFAFHRAWLGKPCPFLNDKGECDIYPVRIIDCRTFTSTTDCREDASGLKRFRFPFELVANNIILEHRSDVYLSAVHHWMTKKLFDL